MLRSRKTGVSGEDISNPHQATRQMIGLGGGWPQGSRLALARDTPYCGLLRADGMLRLSRLSTRRPTS